MNVLPKKRVQQLTQYLMLSRNLSLPRSFSVLGAAFLTGKRIALQGIDLIHWTFSKVPSIHRFQNHSILNSPRRLSLNGFLKSPFYTLCNSRFAWFSAALSLYGWFLFQIATEIFALHRAVTQVSLANYVGVSISMALIWSVTIVFKKSTVSVLSLIKKTLGINKERRIQRRATPSMSTLETTPVLPLFQPRLTPEPKLETSVYHKPLRNNSICTVHLTSSLNIPEPCLICRELISCLSKLN